jgi:hypothetical protein
VNPVDKSQASKESAGRGGTALRLALIWIVATIAGLLIDVAPIKASLIDHHYVPVGADSFYHARRILDAVPDPSAFYQFDTRTHVPEGSLITWPWLYDYSMALVTRGALALGLSDDPMAVLVHIPVLVFPLTLLVMIFLCRSLSLGLPATALALAGTALFPTNQGLYSIGNIDHHYVEHLFVLSTLAAALAWLKRPDARTRAALVGILLGLAPGVHSAAFILQLPLMVALATVWLRGRPMPPATPVFAGALVVTTLAVALPSLALREGRFEYVSLSWFQVYIAGCSAAMSVLLWRIPRSRRSIIVAAILVAALLLPVLGEAWFAGRFFAEGVGNMSDISEVQSPLQLWRNGASVTYLAGLYSYLLPIAPVALLMSVLMAWREIDGERFLFWITSAAGLLLLLAQLRLHYFGSFALFMPMLVLADDASRRGVFPAAIGWSAIGATFLFAFMPGVTGRFFAPQMLAGDGGYMMSHRIYQQLGSLCRERPGVMLAGIFDGHYIRFHTDCSVIANNFLVTEQHARKNQEVDSLMHAPASRLLELNPDVRYIYVHRNVLFVADKQGYLELAPPNYPGVVTLPLVKELLDTDPKRLPPEFHLEANVVYPSDSNTTFARVFSLRPPFHVTASP